MTKVDIKEENLNRCRCPYCPVQAESVCPMKKLENFKGPKDNENMAKLYCAGGKSPCDDLKGDKMCMCPSCPVWEEYGLTKMKYCLKGNAEEIG